MSPQMLFALSALLLVAVPLWITASVLMFKVILVLALSRDDGERHAALKSLLVDTLKRR